MILNKKIPISYIFKKVRYDLLNIVIIGLTVHYITAYFIEYLPVMPLTIAAFLGTSISVLLSFKLNQSYNRWWEARKIWGSIVNDSRTLVLQAQSYLKHDQALIRKIGYRQIAWCYCLGQSLRGLDPLENLSAFLPEDEIRKISRQSNKPLAILQLNTSDLSDPIHKPHFDTFSNIHIDRTIVRLCDSMGRAERINTTVFPSTYRYFLHLIIYLFVITLSIGLREVPTLFELPLLLVISSCFFLLEKTAYHLQDPFRNRPSDTSVTAIARTIEINLKELLGESEVPPPLQPTGFYIM
jgi:ion channel-forming bestrophin family protein